MAIVERSDVSLMSVTVSQAYFPGRGNHVLNDVTITATFKGGNSSMEVDQVHIARYYASSAGGYGNLLPTLKEMTPVGTGNTIPANGEKSFSVTTDLYPRDNKPIDATPTENGTAKVPSRGGLVITLWIKEDISSAGWTAKSIPFYLGQDETDKYMPIWLKPFEPSLAINAVRCTASGTPSDEGNHVLIAAKMNTSGRFSLAGMQANGYPSAPAVYLGTDKEGMAVGTSNSYGLTLQNCQAGIYEFAINPSTGKVTNNLASGASPKISDAISASSDYCLKIAFNDPYEPCSAIVSIPRAFANVHLSEYSGGGVCFGGYSKSASESKALFETYYPTRLYQGVEQIGEKNAEGSLWTEFAESSLQNGATTPAAYGCSLRMRKIEGKCIIRGSVMIKPGSGTIVIANLAEEYKPMHSAYKLAACQGARIARIAVYGASDSNLENYGKLVLEWVRNLSDGDLYTSAAIWVDCSIEYWVNDIIGD